jgi:hypothetical protein
MSAIFPRSRSEAIVTLRSYTLAVLFRHALLAALEVAMALLFLIAIGEAFIHWPEIYTRLFPSHAPTGPKFPVANDRLAVDRTARLGRRELSERAREISQPVETAEKSAKL